MNGIDEIERIKEQQIKNNCPTAVLFYIVTGRMAPMSVDPWYGQIKKLTGNADRNLVEFHQALIYGMYPELKEACHYFNVSVKKRLEKGEKLSAQSLAQIENDTIGKYNLPKSYFIGHVDAQQQKRVDANMKSALDKMKAEQPLQKNIKTTGEVLKIPSIPWDWSDSKHFR
ncbi:MAG: hypothetical protein J6Y53_03950 [Alphaproteobacteria bacterium]|nr:hypothetical protein [Alphaproteobacteria bacterium]